MEIMDLITLMNILPDPPTGTPNELAQDGITFFSTWITRMGGMVAFVGAIKFALSVKSDDAKEQLQAVLTMISGFMIQAAVGNLDIFAMPAIYSQAAADAEFKAIMDFIGSWIGRVGALAAFIGAIMFGLSVRNNDAGQKVGALKTIAAGGITISVSAMLSSFV